jgi:ABC-2 type transport system ATP-binding protein
MTPADDADADADADANVNANANANANANNTSPALLQVRDLAFAYPGRQVFVGWRADFFAGITWVQGGNGSGKSTLLKLLAGALPPAVGDVQAAGVHAQQQPLHYRRQVFWCGPGAIAFDHLRPPEYFAFLRGLYIQFDMTQLQRHVAAMGLLPYMGTVLRDLSTGTQRKVWLAAAFAVGTPVVLLDEPLNALDAASHQHVLAQLARCAADTQHAWIVASHGSLGAAGDGAIDAAIDAAVKLVLAAP